MLTAKFLNINTPGTFVQLQYLFWAFSPEPKGQLTQNLVGSIKDKTVLIRNPRWPPWLSS